MPLHRNKYLKIKTTSGMCFGCKKHPISESICKEEIVKETERVKLLVC